MPSKKSKLKHATVIGVFATRDDAQAALRDLRAAGFGEDAIGLVARDAAGRTVDEGGHTYADEGAVAGAVAGVGVGTLIGIGVLANVIPVVGPAIVAGTLGTLLTNAAGGAVALGLAGALIGWGIPEEDAKYYEGEVKAGRYLVTVAAGDRKDEAWAIVHKHGGYTKESATAGTAGATTTRRTARTPAKAVAGVEARAAAGQTLQLKEERLTANKSRAKAGAVAVRKEVVTERKSITVPVEREEIVIERRPVRVKSAAPLKAEQIVIPVSEERVTVKKDTVVKEEVSVGKRTVAGTKTVGGTVRREELKVEEAGNVEVKGTTATRRRKV